MGDRRILTTDTDPNYAPIDDHKHAVYEGCDIEWVPGPKLVALYDRIEAKPNRLDYRTQSDFWRLHQALKVVYAEIDRRGYFWSGDRWILDDRTRRC